MLPSEPISHLVENSNQPAGPFSVGLRLTGLMNDFSLADTDLSYGYQIPGGLKLNLLLCSEEIIFVSCDVVMSSSSNLLSCLYPLFISSQIR